MSRTLITSILSLFYIYKTNGFQQLPLYYHRPCTFTQPFHKTSSWSRPHVSSNRIFTMALSSVTPNLNSSSSTQKGRNHHQTKLRILKDRMWVRETLEDLTAAEFASSIAMATSSSSSIPGQSSSSASTSSSSSRIKKSRSAVDFDNILNNLNRRIEDMCVTATVGEAQQLGVSCHILNRPTKDSENDSPSTTTTSSSYSDDYCFILRDNVGKGSVTYTTEQRDALLVRLLSSRERILHAMRGQSDNEEDNLSTVNEIRVQLQTDDVPPEENLFSHKSKTGVKTGGGGSTITTPELFIREDGTIDWDGALQDREALKKFGITVWARINGRDPETVDEESLASEENNKSNNDDQHGSGEKVTAKIVDTIAIVEKRQRLNELQTQLKMAEMNHTALLNSAVKAGSAVANVNLAMLEPELRVKIRASAQALDEIRDMVSFQTINYELERIYTYLDGELGNTSTKGYIPLQDRLNVAEFGLLESQFESLNNQLANGEAFDTDVLAVLLEQTVDFKRRLGIDFYVTGLTLDREAIKMWFIDLKTKTMKGLSFYGRGIELFWNDIVFSSSLIGKASFQGYTLKPREVRTLRRTFKDILTFIPVVIILIIPLSPVGHVLVFGAIQRFFPDFFPSCFTERRQNLLSLYETTEFSEYTIDENWQEKLVRISEATAYRVADSAKKLYKYILGLKAKVTDEDE